MTVSRLKRDRRQACQSTNARKQLDVLMTLRSLTESPRRLLWLICLVGIAIVVVSALRAAPQISTLLLEADNDDQMRLMEVRDLLSGQSWWDTRQYRVLPPEGISMHWSRYIDAGIAGIILAASTLVSTASAELFAVILWPSFLACLAVLVLSHGTARLLTPVSAIGAIAVFLSWSKLGGEFVPPRIDHHNVQILCGIALFYLSLIPGRPWVLGALGGVVTAISLAIGLELLPYYATIWGLMALRHAFGQTDTGRWLLGFGVGISLSAPLLLAGQTPVSGWATPWCDVLAPPVMALGLVGVVATTVPVLAERVLTGPLPRIAVLLVLTGLGIWLAFPLLGQCLAGPYSAVSPEVRSMIQNNVVEALSASALLDRNPVLLGRVILPPLLIAALAPLAHWRLRDRLTPRQSTALMQSYIVVAVGLAFALIQIRAANLMTPAIPFLAGFLVYGFSLIPRENWLRLPAMLVLLLALPVVVQNAVNSFQSEPEPTQAARPEVSTAQTSAPQDSPARNCRTPTAMAEISRLPQSLIFSTLNIGPAILAYTPHSVTSAAYHRSMDAFWNGAFAFLSEDSLRAAVVKSGADYVVLCRGSLVELTNPYTAALLAGNLPDWLADESGDAEEVKILKVDTARLAAIP